MLDTNTCIFAINGNLSVRSRFILAYSFGLVISAITEAELWYGVENSTAPEKNAEVLLKFLATVETLPFDTRAAAEYGRVRTGLKRAGTPIGDRDTLIAAHAKSVGVSLVTNNTNEFGRVKGLALEDWKD
jgi:tRNA(fMet)-specific endonuclease VapC